MDNSWCFGPVLESNCVKLTPFVSSVHAQAFWNETKDHPEVYTYLPFGPFSSLSALVVPLEKVLLSDPTVLIYAILDKSSSPPPVAGLAGYLQASPRNLSAKVGMLVCFPAFQRRGIMASAVALLLQYGLRLPSEPEGGLGLRRLHYQVDVGNVGSLALAKKMGSRMEGVQRWQFVLAGHKPGNGREVREGDPRPGMKGRDTAILGVCWDDWEEGVKDAVCVGQNIMYAPK